MKLSAHSAALLEAADGKALATYSVQSGVHVVPVSSIRLEDEAIILVNYFFEQTLKNIEENPTVALAAWKGLEGIQVKATVRQETSGARFESVVEWIRETIPSRTVRGILVLTPVAVSDVSADVTRAGTVIS